MTKKLVMFILLFFPAQLCFAGEVIDLEKIVITPYKVGVSVSQNPSSTDVILVEELNAKGIFSLTNAIKNIPSLSCKSSGLFTIDSSVFIRGANSYHTQVILDDIKIYDPMHVTANFSAFNVMSLDNVKRVEVLKGPYSSLYGSAAIGGTISLFTRKGEGKPAASYTQEFGSYQTSREILESQGKINKLAYSFAVSRLDVRDFYAGKYKDGNYETDPYENFNTSLRLDYEIGENLDIGLLADYTYAMYQNDGWGGADTDNDRTHFYQRIGGVNLEHFFTDLFSYKVNLAYTRTYRKGWEVSSGDFWYDGKTYQIKWKGDYELFDFDKIIFGFDYLREKGEDFAWSTRDPKQTAHTKGYYIENIFTPMDNLFFAASLRIEDHSTFEWHETFSLSGSYVIEQTHSKIKGSFGEGFRAPSLYELYNGLYGNINLKPEESESYEVGFEQKLGDSFTFGSTYFRTQFTNLVESDPVTRKQINAGKARIYGIESIVEYLLNDNIKLSVEHSHMDTKKNVDGSRLTHRPNNKLTAKVKTKFDKLEFNAEVSYVGNRKSSATVKLKSYILGNISLNYQHNDKLNTFLRFENILDDDYELVSGYQTPKFSWYLGAKYTF